MNLSQYTTTFRAIIESGFDIGLRDYPIYDEGHRTELNEKIKNHFYFREIGFETAGRFVFILNRTMAEIMPYYNELYKTAALEYDLLKPLDTTETIGSESTGNTKAQSSDSAKSLFSDTPQGLLQTGDIENEKYLTTATLNSGSSNSNSDVSSKANSTTHKTGNPGISNAQLILDYRKTIVNIDNMILNDPELEDCFMQIW